MNGKEWDGTIERRQDMLNLVLEVKALSLRFDTELGSTTNHALEGSVKRHMREMQNDLREVKEVLLGDGKAVEGLVGRITLSNKLLNDHIFWDRWLFALLIVGQMAAVAKMAWG